MDRREQIENETREFRNLGDFYAFEMVPSQFVSWLSPLLRTRLLRYRLTYQLVF